MPYCLSNNLGLYPRFLDKANTYFQEFGLCKPQPDRNTATNHLVTSERCPPPIGTLKCNFDAAFHNHDKQGAAGAVFRDHLRRFQGCKAELLQSCVSVALLEALALRGATRLAEEKGWRSVSFEGDAEMIVDMVNGCYSVSQEVATVIDDIVSIKEFFSHCSFKFVSRTINWVADMFAKKALICNGFVRDSTSQLKWLNELLNL
ncbi:uncharacterized protein LOC8285489 [Ricinus communis]|uniref:uncharacterized protein LOC8285489 n=1 Tax=Ricinus communis TaxID=3988 RepID=UPI00201A2FD5|nr:uncharacterized protein LOC8285489 [Ricinus communis]XP_048227258.1 uncharacterized protein LOC8285489 [Ricinus communis]